MKRITFPTIVDATLMRLWEQLRGTGEIPDEPFNRKKHLEIVEHDPRLNLLKPGHILASALEPGPNKGITLAEMEKRLPIARKLRKANSQVLLEDAEWKELMEGVDRTQWLRIDEDILAICQAARNAEDVKVKEAKARSGGEKT